MKTPNELQQRVESEIKKRFSAFTESGDLFSYIKYKYYAELKVVRLNFGEVCAEYTFTKLQDAKNGYKVFARVFEVETESEKFDGFDFEFETDVCRLSLPIETIQKM